MQMATNLNPDYLPITIDSREAAAHPQIVQYLAKAGMPILSTTLKSGDYSFISPYEVSGRIPKIGIELCTVSDLIGKLDGRLSWQLGNMIQDYDVPYLLIDGTIYPDDEGYIVIAGNRVARADRLGDILHGAQSHGVIVMQDENAPERLRRIIAYWHRPCDSHQYFRPNAVVRDVNVPVAESLDERVIFLMGVPGIGEDRATAALAHYGSLLPILCSPVESLIEIPGWGKKTALAFRAFVDTMDRVSR